MDRNNVYLASRGWAETNPLNGPAWSLQWEYIANILYPLIYMQMSWVDSHKDAPPASIRYN